jgi:transcriptional regulator with XRE-family HTH domain
LAKGFQDSRYRQLIQRLVERRRELKLSQRALAERLRMPQQIVSRYETGDRRLDLIELIDVAEALGLSAVDMIKPIEPKRPPE